MTLKVYVDYSLLLKIKEASEPAVMLGLSQQLRKNYSFENCFFYPILSWEALFSCINSSPFGSDFLSFDPSSLIMSHVLEALRFSKNPQILVDLYDQLFIDCLTRVQNTPEVNVNFLLDKITKIKKQANFFTSPVLTYYEHKLTHHTADAFHDLVLYFAWDRLCVQLAYLFELEEESPSILANLAALKECLIESFFHIRSQKRTEPVFFRFAEALFADAMRPEKLNEYSKFEWETLCEGAKALKVREPFSRVCYIEYAMRLQKLDNEEQVIMLTNHNEAEVRNHFLLMRFFLNKIEKDHPQWSSAGWPLQVIPFNLKF